MVVFNFHYNLSYFPQISEKKNYNLRICIRDFCEKFPEKKILSICFGTQIMAEILGGTIDYCDNDEFYNGESEIKFTDCFHDFLEEKASDQDLMSSIHMRIYHENYISSVPEGAMVYGIGKYQMPYLIKFSQNNWGFQPHIECKLACGKQQKDLDIFLKKFFRKFLEN